MRPGPEPLHDRRKQGVGHSFKSHFNSYSGEVNKVETSSRTAYFSPAALQEVPVASGSSMWRAHMNVGCL